MNQYSDNSEDLKAERQVCCRRRAHGFSKGNKDVTEYQARGYQGYDLAKNLSTVYHKFIQSNTKKSLLTIER